MDIHNRINQIIHKVSSSAAQFADELGVQRSSISHIISGRNKPSAEFLQKLLSTYPSINIEWILSGNGDMFNNNVQRPKDLFSDLQQSNKIVVNNPSDEIVEPVEIKQSVIPKTNINKKGIDVKKHNAEQIENTNKEIKKVIVVYEDNTFEVYNQAKS